MKNKNHIFCAVILTVFSLNHVYSQGFARPNAWKKYRKELIVQVGAAGFLGDLGGRNMEGTDISPADMELALTRPALSVAFRYKFTKNINVHSSFNYLVVAGDDKLTSEIYRNNRNLNFKSNIFEVATRLEFGITSVKRTGIYSLHKSLGRMNKRKSLELIGFVGIGAFYFNPKGKDPSGNYIALYPLHTEGQGLPGGPTQYKKIAISIPMGLALHYIIDKYWSVGLELSYRKTFTDYIDDVSSSYYPDKAALNAAYGPTSVMMSDPSKGDIPGASAPNADGTGAQRGDKNKDSFASLQITIGRFFPPKRGRTKLRSKF
ncbi:MAG: hypothetical protein JNM51_03960 [Bacteroidia bacterium]|nr:hypothetical protein [Bacteroidia bacterium]